MKIKKILSIFFIVFTFFSLFFACFELVFRIFGYRPFQYISTTHESVIMERDPDLGWKNKTGVYVNWLNAWSEGDKIKVTIWPDGQRATAENQIHKNRKIILLGSSSAMGWALSDEETFLWKLQERFTDIEFQNYASGGYSTYQSLLILEKILKDLNTSPEIIFYVFDDTHIARNIANPSILKQLAQFSRRGHSKLPYCFIGENGALKRCTPIGYPDYFFNKHSAVLEFLLLKYLYWQSKDRLLQKEGVTRKLLLEMNILAKSMRSELLILFLSNNKFVKEKYQKFLLGNRINFLDCNLSQNLTSDLKIKGSDPHPSGEMNLFWSECIASYLATHH